MARIELVANYSARLYKVWYLSAMFAYEYVHETQLVDILGGE